MRRWSIKRLYRESVAFKWTAKFFIFGVVISLLIFGIQNYQDSKNKEFFKDQFLKTQKICSKNQAQCSDEDTIKKLNEYKDLVDDFYVRAERAIEGGHYNEARYFYDRIAKADSKYTNTPNFWYNYAIVLQYQTEYGTDLEPFQKAKEAIDRAYELDSDNIDIIFERGHIYYSLGKLQKNIDYYTVSIKLFNDLLSKNPNHILL